MSKVNQKARFRIKCMCQVPRNVFFVFMLVSHVKKQLYHYQGKTYSL